MAWSGIISTGRLLIEPFSEKHLSQRYVNWLNDPDVVRFSEQRFKSHTLDSCREYMHSFEGTPNFFWACVSLDPNIGHIGNINAFIDINNMSADVGILIGESKQWGKGYGFEAFTAVVNFLFREEKIRKVTVGTLVVNKGMMKIISRLGMIDDGRRLRHVLLNGEEVDVVHGALFRSEWLNQGR
ncbi:GNAT family N-acetyltransferase [Thermodesulfobacteriota bacterium]